jgi:peptidoglycan/LPS O-acetylase OafA/YrhL
MSHPSFYTLSPIIGVLLIIWFSDKNEPITKMLSSKLFVGIGLISYSLYLWHYPVLSFSRIMNSNQEVEIGNKLIIIIIIFILSIISYYLVEKTLRKKKVFTLILFFILSFSLLLITINLIVVFKNGFSSRFAKILQDQGNLDQMGLLKNEIN